jgi:hypothetical protein
MKFSHLFKTLLVGSGEWDYSYFRNEQEEHTP